MVVHKINLPTLLPVLAILLLGQSLAHAGEYFLIERESYQLCRDLVKNFNHFKDDEPMVCELKFYPGYKDFRLPKWEEINPKQYTDTLERLLVDETKYSWPAGIPGLKKRINEGKVKLWRSRIDINFDGRKNTIYKMQEYACNVKRDYTRDNMPRYRFMAEQNDPDPKHPRFEYLNGNVFGGIFYYKGRPYFNSWIQDPLFTTEKSQIVKGSSPRVAVYETSQSVRFHESFAITPVCEIGYRK
ncbi:hypothetical protein MNBD_GAMMA24-146 [hydrothermal vent metagenome]|uniref:Uncharacterized protein n=1 Tax=hydrothermal vent metagenome TaxID=652676 RepID=A0A3B1BDK5_9ZZZZ